MSPIVWKLLRRTLDSFREGAKLLVPSKSDTQTEKHTIKKERKEKSQPTFFSQKSNNSVRKSRLFDKLITAKTSKKRSTYKSAGWTTKALSAEYR